ncbi:MAG: carbon-nitrogen hydrolase family protein [Acidimicrobiales bacterium]
MTTTLRVAAIQPALRLGEVDWNLRRCETLVRAAVAEHDPDIVVLPEAMTSPNVFDPVLRSVPRPIDGEPKALLEGLARELNCVVGGGFLAVRGSDAYQTFVVAEPDGATSMHDKDEPSAWENCYYRGGSDDGVFTRSFATMGVVSGWETARSRTAKRLRAAQVNLIIGGECWPAYPKWPLVGRWMRRDQEYYRLWAKGTPGQLARAVGAPAVLAWHVGDIVSRTPMIPGLRWPTMMTGETQIVERDGRILERLSYEDGEGYISADVTIASPEPLDPIPSGLWLRPQPFTLHSVWHYQKLHGRARYRIDKALRRFPWQ